MNQIWKLSLVPLLVLSISCTRPPQKPGSPSRFPIYQEGRWGFVDANGAVVIPPQYRAACAFSEGLAAVRVEGTYGYVDEHGKMVVPPKYDFALPFEDSLAKVYEDGEAYYIDHAGKALFRYACVEILPTHSPDAFLVRNETHEWGMVNRKGKELVKPQFVQCEAFEGGVIFTRRFTKENEEGEMDRYQEMGLVNFKGNWTIPLGKFNEIRDKGEGLLWVEKVNPQDEDDEALIVDLQGNLIWQQPENYAIVGRCHRGVMPAEIRFSKTDPERKDANGNDRYTYYGFVSAKGKLMKVNKTWEGMGEFEHGCAFVRDTADRFWLVDTQGKLLNRKPWDWVSLEDEWRLEGGFEEGTAIVKSGDELMVIDTLGQVISRHPVGEFLGGNSQRKGQVLYFAEEVLNEEGDYVFLWGYYDLRTGKEVAPQFESIDFTIDQQALTTVWEDGRMGLVDEKGNYQWRAPEVTESAVVPLNVDFMLRGYFYANSPYLDKYSGSGGWGDADLAYKKIAAGNNFPAGELGMQVREGIDVRFAENYEGMLLSLYNSSADTVIFEAQDSRLYLVLQAKDQHGEWRDIEYLPSSWCGNSYHQLFLPPGRFWEFNIPKYEGSLKTELRAKLILPKSPDEDEDSAQRFVYSKPFAGSVNPGQFWRKREYFPQGLMDPYND